MPTRRRISLQVPFVDRETARRDRAGARREDAVEVQHQGRLAGAVGPEHRDALARVHVEVDTEQRLVSVGVGEREAAYVEDRRARRVYQSGNLPV